MPHRHRREEGRDTNQEPVTEPGPQSARGGQPGLDSAPREGGPKAWLGWPSAGSPVTVKRHSDPSPRPSPASTEACKRPAPPATQYKGQTATSASRHTKGLTGLWKEGGREGGGAGRRGPGLEALSPEPYPRALALAGHRQALRRQAHTRPAVTLLSRAAEHMPLCPQAKRTDLHGACAHTSSRDVAGDKYRAAHPPCGDLCPSHSVSENGREELKKAGRPRFSEGCLRLGPLPLLPRPGLMMMGKQQWCGDMTSEETERR